MIDCQCSSRRRGIAAGATLVIAVIPKFGCPLCAPFLAAILGMLGLSLPVVGWLLAALTAGFAGYALFLLVRDWRHPAPAVLAIVAAAIMLTYRLIDLPESTRYFGASAFAIALIWRAWRRMRFQHTEEISLKTEEP